MSTPEPTPVVPSVGDAPTVAPTSVGDAPTAGDVAKVSASTSTQAVPGFELLGELGRGGMGVVYRARHLSLNRVVALKMVLAGAHASPKARARFTAESEAIAQLQHPGIVQVFEVGSSGELPWCALEFCPGGSLADRFVGQPQPPREAARMVEALARAVQHAHAHNIIHRDLKPANVLVASDGTLKVTDFGLAKFADGDDGLTATGAVMGTPAYMSPEQARGESRSVGPAADVWALGVMLYEALTGRRPFVGESMAATLALVQHTEPVALRQVVRSVPRDLEVICLKCLAKEPAGRYASAEALADDLRRWQAGEPITARAVGRGERAVKWVRRNPVVAGALALVAVVLVLASVVSTVFGLDAREQATQAERARGREKERADGETKAKEEANAEKGKAQEREQQANAAKMEAQQEREKAETRRKEAVAAKDEAEFRVYVGKIALAQSEWERGDVAAAYRALDECRWDLRNWEHDYLWSTFQQNQTTLRGHAGVVYSVAISGDGRRIVSGSSDSTIKVWDAATGQDTLTLKGHASIITSVAFSPEGKRIVSGAQEGAINVWDATTGQKTLLLEGHTRRVNSAAFSGDDKRIVSGSDDQTIRIWDASTGREILVLQGHTNGVDSVGFSPDGERIVSGSFDKMIKVWHATTGQEILNLKGHAFGVTSVAFSPEGNRIVSLDQKGVVKVWDVVSGVEVPEAPGKRPADTRTVALHSDSRRLEALGTTVIVTDPRRPDRQAIVDRERLARWAQPDPAYHRREADTAEKANQPFAAAFHLQRLLDLAPEDADTVRKRLADARAKLKE